MLKVYRIISYIMSAWLLLSAIVGLYSMFFLMNAEQITPMLKFILVITLFSSIATFILTIRTRGINNTKKSETEILDSVEVIPLKNVRPKHLNRMLLSNLISGFYFIAISLYGTFKDQIWLLPKPLFIVSIVIYLVYIMFGIFQINYVFTIARIYNENHAK